MGRRLPDPRGPATAQRCDPHGHSPAGLGRVSGGSRAGLGRVSGGSERDAARRAGGTSCATSGRSAGYAVAISCDLLVRDHRCLAWAAAPQTGLVGRRALYEIGPLRLLTQRRAGPQADASSPLSDAGSPSCSFGAGRRGCQCLASSHHQDQARQHDRCLRLEPAARARPRQVHVLEGTGRLTGFHLKVDVTVTGNPSLPTSVWHWDGTYWFSHHHHHHHHSE